MISRNNVPRILVHCSDGLAQLELQHSLEVWGSLRHKVVYAQGGLKFTGMTSEPRTRPATVVTQTFPAGDALYGKVRLASANPDSFSQSSGSQGSFFGISAR